MKFIRYAKGKPEYRGIIDGDIIKRINGTIFHDYSLTADTYNINDVKILPPVLPAKIIGFRSNYNGTRENIKPKYFIKPASTLAACNENIVIPKNADNIYVEGELAVVISKKAKNIAECHALSHILGFTIANDVTASFEESDMTITLGKSYDTFTPLGPFINTDTNNFDFTIETYKNSNLVQSGHINNMVYDIFFQISYLSHIMTLNPGDVILTGTPSNAVNVKNGDVIEIKINSLGVLKNTVVEEL